MRTKSSISASLFGEGGGREIGGRKRYGREEREEKLITNKGREI